jgi:UDP-N-acetylglucosamine--N-acetylmuramyl-(pentapeptide) pyrophosphoryl-undecaprenol N-acetylglucosamine transferase
LAKELSKPLLKKGVKVIHQCGKKEYVKLKEFYKKEGLEVELYDFIKDMPAVLNRADLAISRSGASTLWELCTNALPAVFIPYPYAAGDHQYYNAKFLKDKNLTYLFRENGIKPDKILTLINTIDLHYISSNLKQTIHKNAAKKIVEYISKT